jgi:hypothetical protein
MNKQGAFAASLAVLLVVLAVSAILLTTRKNRVELTGEVLKVRSFQNTPDSTLALIDLRIKNPSTQQFVVRDLEVFVDRSSEEPLKASVFSETDARRAVDFYTPLGQKYTPGLVGRTALSSEETMDRSLLIQVPLTDEQFGQRTGLRIVVEDVDGAVTTLAEKR